MTLGRPGTFPRPAAATSAAGITGTARAVASSTGTAGATRHPAPPPRPGSRAIVLDRYAMTLLKVMLVGAIVLQRFQVAGVPVTLLVLWAGVVLLAVWRRLVVSAWALLAFLGTAALLGLVAWIATAYDRSGSMTSYLLLLLLYAPWVLRLKHGTGIAAAELGRFFVGLAGLFGFVGAAQIVAQYAHVWEFTDYLGRLPAAFLVPGYNAEASLSYGSGIWRPQSFVFLEPSFLSQTSALAILVGLALRVRARSLLGPVLGLAASLSGTGVVLLGVGLALIVVARPRVLRPSFVVLGAIGVAAVLLSPASDTLLGRTSEIGQTGSSGSLRFIDPYQEVLDGLAALPVRVLAGAGPGASDRLLATDRGTGVGQAVVYTIPAKLVFEYGAPAGLLFLAFLVASLLPRSGIPLLGPTVLFMVMVLSGALLQPHTNLLAWLLVVVWGGRRTSSPVHDSAGDRTAADAERRTSPPGGSLVAPA